MKPKLSQEGYLESDVAITFRIDPNLESPEPVTNMCEIFNTPAARKAWGYMHDVLFRVILPNTNWYMGG